MHCPACHVKMTDNARFCHQCGKPIPFGTVNKSTESAEIPFPQQIGEIATDSRKPTEQNSLERRIFGKNNGQPLGRCRVQHHLVDRSRLHPAFSSANHGNADIVRLVQSRLAPDLSKTKRALPFDRSEVRPQIQGSYAELQIESKQSTWTMSRLNKASSNDY